jgi:hypothetical protein
MSLVLVLLAGAFLVLGFGNSSREEDEIAAAKGLMVDLPHSGIHRDRWIK